MSIDGAFIGVADHFGWAVMVTAAAGGALIERRRVELVDEGLPKYPHHYEAQRLPRDEAVALVERVRLSAERNAAAALDAVAHAVPSRIVGVALRALQPLPPTVAERIESYRAQNVADSVMYRQALAGAAEARGWSVHWYDPKKVLAAAADALQIEDFEAHSLQMRRSVGPPWGTDQKLAMAAAIVAGQAGQRR